ncbi:MAG: hypothetical protein AAFQ80_20390 [Cyanobacteria bacterium J06621_8]
MKKYIKWALDYEDSIDPADPLGNITFAGDTGIIREKDIFLDSFLEALVEGLSISNTQKISSIEIIDEPDKLIFIKHNQELQIQYKNQSITIYDIDSFSYQLSISISNFLSTIDTALAEMGKQKYEFDQLRTYVERHSEEQCFFKF